MNIIKPVLFLAFTLCTGLFIHAQDTSHVFRWNVTSKKLHGQQYEILFFTNGSANWQLFAPNQDLAGVSSSSVKFDSSISNDNVLKDSGAAKNSYSDIFSIPVKTYGGATSWKTIIKIS